MNDQHAPALAASLGDPLGSSSALAETRDARGHDVPTLTKAELAEMLFEQVGLNKRESKDMVEAFF
ncbi:MAG: integration host factor subunit alpha, partial [Ralstonia mannitolilytica]